MTEVTHEGYDFIVMLISAYREFPDGLKLPPSELNIEVMKFGLDIEWLKHHRGSTGVYSGCFLWTEKAEREILHLDEWE